MRAGPEDDAVMHTPRHGAARRVGVRVATWIIPADRPDAKLAVRRLLLTRWRLMDRGLSNAARHGRWRTRVLRPYRDDGALVIQFAGGIGVWLAEGGLIQLAVLGALGVLALAVRFG